MTYVYVHLFPNGKAYVGIADNPEQRWKSGHGYKDNPEMYEDILLYGWRNIQHIIAAECNTREEALTLEREYILAYDSENPEKGYNQTGIKEKIIERIKAKNTMVEGFGELRSAAEWARIVGVHRSTFSRYLQQGLTVEDVFRARGIMYRDQGKPVKCRKPRQSAEMRETQSVIYQLLTWSGYTIDVGPESVEVKPTNNQRHLITFKGLPFGEYNYRTGELKLSNKTGIPLKMPGLDFPLVSRNHIGLWEPHPETVREILALKAQKDKTI